MRHSAWTWRDETKFKIRTWTIHIWIDGVTLYSLQNASKRQLIVTDTTFKSAIQCLLFGVTGTSASVYKCFVFFLYFNSNEFFFSFCVFFSTINSRSQCLWRSKVVIWIIHGASELVSINEPFGFRINEKSGVAVAFSLCVCVYAFAYFHFEMHSQFVSLHSACSCCCQRETRNTKHALIN